MNPNIPKLDEHQQLTAADLVEPVEWNDEKEKQYREFKFAKDSSALSRRALLRVAHRLEKESNLSHHNSHSAQLGSQNHCDFELNHGCRKPSIVFSVDSVKEQGVYELNDRDKQARERYLVEKTQKQRLEMKRQKKKERQKQKQAAQAKKRQRAKKQRAVSSISPDLVHELDEEAFAEWAMANNVELNGTSVASTSSHGNSAASNGKSPRKSPSKRETTKPQLTEYATKDSSSKNASRGKASTLLSPRGGADPRTTRLVATSPRNGKKPTRPIKSKPIATAKHSPRTNTFLTQVGATTSRERKTSPPSSPLAKRSGRNDGGEFVKKALDLMEAKHPLVSNGITSFKNVNSLKLPETNEHFKREERLNRFEHVQKKQDPRHHKLQFAFTRAQYGREQGAQMVKTIYGTEE